MGEISTRQSTVSTITSKFTSSLSHLAFSPKENFSYSQSVAASGLTASLTSLSGVINNFESYAVSDVQKLMSIHQAIVSAEKASVGS
ncbi:DUF3130 family protein [Erwinia sp. CPCC 100877]|nr:DUF3130 family protein [Erwinia sp. CPCC 100877]